MFTGDALFSMGCGRMFEGTPAQMWAGLERLAALPDEPVPAERLEVERKRREAAKAALEGAKISINDL